MSHFFSETRTPEFMQRDARVFGYDICHAKLTMIFTTYGYGSFLHYSCRSEQLKAMRPGLRSELYTETRNS